LSTGRSVCLLSRKVCELASDIVARVVFAIHGGGVSIGIDTLIGRRPYLGGQERS